MITLNFGKSEYSLKPTPDLVIFPDMTIDIPIKVTLKRIHVRYIETNKPAIHLGPINNKENSKRSFVYINFPLLIQTDSLEEEEVFVVWIEERGDWIAIIYNRWREDFFFDENYSGPFELDDFCENQLLRAYGIDWQRSLSETVRQTSPQGFIREIIAHAAASNVTELSITNKEIEALPPEIGKLTDLTSLKLSNNQLTSLPPEIGQLENLTFLSLIENQLTELPKEIGRLANLKSLYVNFNKLKTVPEEIGQLQNLRSLGLIGNLLDYLPPQIGLLANLDYLHLGGNQLTRLPAELGQLKKLTTLILISNQIKDLPAKISQLNNLKYLNLENNPLPLPPEIVRRKNSRIILDYYFSRIKKHLNEVKLLIVGQGSVGKTSLIERILHDTFDPNQTKTEGISIKQWKIEESNKASAKKLKPIRSRIETTDSQIKLNLWDFGGQEIMHATHQFFLTKRSLYILVLDARLTQEENRVEYWLKIIQSFGGESPVLILGNKADQHSLDIDRTGLGKKYPNIVGILETSAATGAGIEALKTEIAKQVDTLPHIHDLLPETWFTVKSKLEGLGRDKNFITQDEYLSLCDTNDITDETSQHTLIGFLHDLGVVLHFQDDPRLEALGILNPQWVTNGVYKILNSHELFQNQGKLTLPLLHRILDLPEYPQDKHLFIVDMMKKFELCYEIDEKSLLIPDLLPKDEPFLDDWLDSLAFQYQYNILPSSIITRFIVRMEAFVHTATTWRSGTVLIGKENNALVKADYEDRSISIYVRGNTESRSDFLSVIREEFNTIHKTIAKIEITEKVPISSYPGAIPPDYNFLLRMERENRSSFPVQAGNDIVDVSVAKLLNDIRPSKEVKVFISYSHDDKEFVKKLAKELEKSQAKVWWDFSALKGGQNWQKEIQQGIKLCEFFLVVLTPQGVESEWVNREIIYAMEYKKPIIPLYLKPCERPISIIEKQYIDFEKQTQKAAIKELIVILRVQDIVKQ